MKEIRSQKAKSPPWLSVLMPVHEGSRWLAETLHSIASQRDNGIEILIMDSSADQASENIVSQYTGHLHIHYRHDALLKSWPRKTNLMASEARAPFLAMLHQDDLWLPGRVKAIKEMIRLYPDVAIYLNPSEIIDQGGNRCGTWRCPLPKRQVISGRELIERLLVQNFIAIPSPIIRKDTWKQSGGMDESLWYTADWDLYLKLAAHSNAVYDQQITTAFRVHSDSLTVTGSRQESDFSDQMHRVINRHISQVSPEKRWKIRKLGLVSATVNANLARAMRGDMWGLLASFAAVLKLNPIMQLQYFRQSRLLDRVKPRLRAMLAGRL